MILNWSNWLEKVKYYYLAFATVMVKFHLATRPLRRFSIALGTAAFFQMGNENSTSAVLAHINGAVIEKTTTTGMNKGILVQIWRVKVAQLPRVCPCCDLKLHLRALL